MAKLLEAVKDVLMPYRLHDTWSFFCDHGLHPHCTIKGCECPCHPKDA